MYYFKNGALVSAIASFVALPGFAQVVQTNVEPGRVEADLRPSPSSSTRLAQQIRRLNFGLPNHVLASEKFVLSGFEIVGGKFLSKQQRDVLRKPWLKGQVVSALDVANVARAIQQQYSEAGYNQATVYRPLYSLDGDKVRVEIEVREAQIAKIDYPKADPLNKSRFEYWEKKLRSENFITDDTLYRYQSLIKELPGLDYSSATTSTTVPGKVALGVAANPQEKKPFSVTINNRGTDASGPVKVAVTGEWTRLGGGNNRLNLSYNGALDWGEQHYVFAQYDTWVGNEGAILSVYGSKSSGKPGTATLRQLEYTSSGHSLGLKYEYPVAIKPNLDLRVFGLLEHGEFKSEVLSTTNTEDKISFAQLGLTAKWNKELDGFKNPITNKLTLKFTQGLKGFGSHSQSNPNASRGDGRVDFSKLNLDWHYERPLKNNWSLKADVKAQKAFTPLLSSQECGFGGSQFGRAYDASALIGGDCVMFGIEASKAINVKSEWLTGLTGFAAVDHGKVWQKSAASAKGSSIGFGLKGTAKKGVEFTLEAAKPITDVMGIDEKWRLFGSVGMKW